MSHGVTLQCYLMVKEKDLEPCDHHLACLQPGPLRCDYSCLVPSLSPSVTQPSFRTTADFCQQLKRGSAIVLGICSHQIHSRRQDAAPPGSRIQERRQESQLFKSCHFQGPPRPPKCMPHLGACIRDLVPSLPSSKPQPAFPPGTLLSMFALTGNYLAS